MADSIDAVGSVAVAAGTRHLTTPNSPNKEPDPDRLVGAEFTADQIKAAIEHNGNRVSFGGRTAEFSYNEELNRVVVKVFSAEEELVRQIPAEEYMAFAARYRELLGVLFNEQF